MTILTITGSDNNYTVSPNPCVVTDGSLEVIVPVGPPIGCLICLSKDLEDKRSHNLKENKTFNMSKYPKADEWTYEVYDVGSTCPSEAAANAGHVIQIGSGMDGK